MKTLGSHRTKLSLAALVAFAFALLMHAQSSKPQDQSRPDHDSMMSSTRGMMDQCAKQCDDAKQQCDSVIKTLRDARDSNAVKMRSAIDDALKTCAQMQETMTRCTEDNRKACMQMMDMMGGMDRMQGGMMMRPDQSRDNQPKDNDSSRR